MKRKLQFDAIRSAHLKNFQNTFKIMSLMLPVSNNKQKKNYLCIFFHTLIKINLNCAFVYIYMFRVYCKCATANHAKEKQTKI